MIPKSYRSESKPCRKCKHVFNTNDYDDFNHSYCHIDKSERPLCGSVAMDESFYANNNFVKGGDLRREWEKWSEDRYVNGNGTCDEWEGDDD